MFEHLYRSPQEQLAEVLRVLEAGLTRHYWDAWLFVNGRTMHVDDILDALQRHVEQIEGTLAAHELWLEQAEILRDEFRAEISPLLAGLRQFIADEFGAYSPRMREFGFEPVQQASGGEVEELDEGEDAANV